MVASEESDGVSSDSGNLGMSLHFNIPKKREAPDFQWEVDEAVRHCIPEVVQAVVSNVGLQQSQDYHTTSSRVRTVNDFISSFLQGDVRPTMPPPSSVSYNVPEEVKHKVLESSMLQRSGSRSLPQAYSHTSRALGQVKALTSKYEALAFAEDTKRNYTTVANAYIDFFLQLALTDNQGRLLDLSEDQLMHFAVHCAGSKGLAPGTIHSYLYGIQSWYITNGLPDPLKNDNGQPLYHLAHVL